MASDHNHEWMSIGDLMAGVVGVVMLLFVGASVVASEQAERSQQERRQRDQEAREEITRRQAGIRSALLDFEQDIDRTGHRQLVSIDIQSQKIRFKEATFALGSACVQPAARTVIASWSDRIRRLLEERSDREINIEGHTDSFPVTVRPGVLNRCAQFDDNFTLSAARARQARQVLTAGWPESLRERVALAGFGDTRPLAGQKRDSPDNRRVEIAIIERPTPLADPGAAGSVAPPSLPLGVPATNSR